MAEWVSLADAIATHVRDGDVVAMEGFTGWTPQFEETCGQTEPPTVDELKVLRDLKARTAAAHGVEGEAA